jgi:hypothetical protein
LLYVLRGATSAVKEKEKFEKEKARLQGELDGIKHRLNNALNFVEELEQRNTAAEETITKQEEQLEVKFKTNFSYSYGFFVFLRHPWKRRGAILLFCPGHHTECTSTCSIFTCVDREKIKE